MQVEMPVRHAEICAETEAELLLMDQQRKYYTGSYK